MSEATPKKRKRSVGEEDDDKDGAVDGDFIHKCIKLRNPESVMLTIRRRYWEFTHTEDGTLPHSPKLVRTIYVWT